MVRRVFIRLSFVFSQILFPSFFFFFFFFAEKRYDWID